MSNGENSGVRRFFGSITPLQLAGIIIGVLAVAAIAWFIINGTNGGGGNGSILDAENARGLITFSVAIVTVAIALILVMYVIMGTADDNFKDRFTYGKDVLMVFVGILGTIMGYYYAENKLSNDAIRDFKAATAQKPDLLTIQELEKQAFAALLQRNLDASLKAFEDAYRADPTRRGIDEINKLLKNRKDALKPEATERDAAWKQFFCDISKNKVEWGLSTELASKIEDLCAGKPPSNPTPTGTNTSTGT